MGAIKKWGYPTVKRLLLSNPRGFGPDEYATGEGVVTPLSESKELGFVIEILNDALGRDLSGGSRYDVSKAVEILLRLKDQALKGLHRNPEQSGGIHIDIGSHNPRRRARNPPLVLMGVNPPERGTMLRAKWARIEYCRPDDPEGRGVARVHDFPDGFVARGLADGSVLLRHPKGRRLWTRR